MRNLITQNVTLKTHYPSLFLNRSPLLFNLGKSEYRDGVETKPVTRLPPEFVGSVITFPGGTGFNGVGWWGSGWGRLWRRPPLASCFLPFSASIYTPIHYFPSSASLGHVRGRDVADSSPDLMSSTDLALFKSRLAYLDGCSKCWSLEIHVPIRRCRNWSCCFERWLIYPKITCFERHYDD